MSVIISSLFGGGMSTSKSLEQIGRVVRMSVSGYRGWRFYPWYQHVVLLSKTLYPHCFSRL